LNEGVRSLTIAAKPNHAKVTRNSPSLGSNRPGDPPAGREQRDPGRLEIAAIILFAILYSIAPKAFAPNVRFAPVPVTLGAYALFTALPKVQEMTRAARKQRNPAAPLAVRMRAASALRAMDEASLSPGITSAFRDDYRQSLASGNKAAIDSSYHGGSRRGGGHGLAAGASQRLHSQSPTGGPFGSCGARTMDQPPHRPLKDQHVLVVEDRPRRLGLASLGTVTCPKQCPHPPRDRRRCRAAAQCPRRLASRSRLPRPPRGSADRTWCRAECPP
jgi:hypothetical protein